MATRLPLSLMVELAVDCSTKYSVPSALMNSGGGFSSATAGHLAGAGHPTFHLAVFRLPKKWPIKIILPQKLHEGA
jgi:hypothetical protein